LNKKLSSFKSIFYKSLNFIIMKNSLLMLLAVVTAVIFNSCSNEGVALIENQNLDSSANLMAGKPAPLKVDLLHFSSHIEDADFQSPMGDATPLYNRNGGQHVPIMTPDGEHQVTLGEFKMISGWANVKCINAGTHVVMHLKGLIPNGVYTIWTVVFKSPGFDGVSIPNNRIGFGALGTIDGGPNSNAFMADSDGNASISVIRPTGTLLTAGPGSPNPHPDYVVPNCLADAYETHLALAYHLDNQASAPGAPPTWAVQGFFQFWGSQLQ
jgi:hypothetical protein